MRSCLSVRDVFIPSVSCYGSTASRSLTASGRISGFIESPFACLSATPDEQDVGFSTRHGKLSEKEPEVDMSVE